MCPLQSLCSCQQKEIEDDLQMTSMKLMRKQSFGETIFLCYQLEKQERNISKKSRQCMNTRNVTDIYQLESNAHTSCVIITKTKQNGRKQRPIQRPQNRLWERSKTESLLLEPETIKQRLTSNNDPKNIAAASKKFENLMEKRSTNVY